MSFFFGFVAVNSFVWFNADIHLWNSTWLWLFISHSLRLLPTSVFCTFSSLELFSIFWSLCQWNLVTATHIKNSHRCSWNENCDRSQLRFSSFYGYFTVLIPMAKIQLIFSRVFPPPPKKQFYILPSPFIASHIESCKCKNKSVDCAVILCTLYIPMYSAINIIDNKERQCKVEKTIPRTHNKKN